MELGMWVYNPSDSWKNTSECGKSMKFGVIVVFVMENIYSYRPNLKNLIGGNGSHFKNGGCGFLSNTSTCHSNYII